MEWPRSRFLLQSAIKFTRPGPYWLFVGGYLDGDGDKNLAPPKYGSTTVSVLKNNGDGTFAAAVNYAVGRFPLARSLRPIWTGMGSRIWRWPMLAVTTSRF